MKIILHPLIIFIITIFACCLNGWEKEIVGYYEVQISELADSIKYENYDIPTLTLKKDKTFELSFKNNTKTGEWKAYDTGDHTIVAFIMEGIKNDIQGVIGRDHINIYNPYLFDCPFLNSGEMVFKRIRQPGIK